MSTCCYGLIVQEPSMAKDSEKLALNSAKNAAFHGGKPPESE